MGKIPRHFAISGFQTEIIRIEDDVRISASKRKKSHLSDAERRAGCFLGTDSHADISCIGKHGRILEIIEGQVCNVRPFDDSYKPMTGIRTVNAAFAIDLADGTTYILRVNNALDFTATMSNSILCTNQVRHHGIIVDDVPKQVDIAGTSTHSILIPNTELWFPLHMSGPVSGLHVRYPSDFDLEHFEHIHLTSADALWDPSIFAIVSDKTFPSGPVDPTVSAMMITATIQLSSLTKTNLSDLKTPEYLSKLWGIGIKQAKKTLKATTARTIRLLQGVT